MGVFSAYKGASQDRNTGKTIGFEPDYEALESIYINCLLGWGKISLDPSALFLVTF